MSLLDPEKILTQVAKALPSTARSKVYFIGSLAVAYHFRAEMDRRGVNTKDADFVAHPASGVAMVRDIARRLRAAGWTWRIKGEWKPGDRATPVDELADLKLYPPEEHPSFWIEFQGLPERDAAREVDRRRVVLDEGHFALPRYRFARLTSLGLRETTSRIRYADPAMMALANLLSHPVVGSQHMSTPVAGKKCLRSAKDLGRVVAIALLAERREIGGWIEPWTKALRTCFPMSWREIGARTGNGLRELMEVGRKRRLGIALADAHWSVAHGLLSGRAITEKHVEIAGNQLLVDLIAPFEQRCRDA